MLKMSLVGSLLVVCLLFSGCAWMGEAVNPYKSSFNCPLGDNGKCINMTDAYKESLQPENALQPSRTVTAGAQQTRPETMYQASLYKKLTGLLDEPTTPVVAPPKVMRVLLLPYRGGDRELYLYRYVFFVVDDYTWTLGDNIYIGDN
jgi:conjugal transfer pilus assembly protein TraV